MFKEILSPRFAETDALGHINNTVIPVWFEQGREPVFRFFTPDLDPSRWKLIIARIEVDFLAETVFGCPVEIRTFIRHIGNSSFKIGQELWQKEKLCARGLAVMVHFDYHQKKAISLTEEIKSALEEHLQPDE